MTGRLIGIGGYAGSGKDAVADILEDSHGFYRTFMSQPLNAALCRLNPQIEVRHGEVFRYVDLIAQLGGWLTGARHSIAPDCMAQVVKALSPGDIRNVSTYLAGLPADAEARPLPASDEPLPLACGGATHFDPVSGVSP